MLAHTFITVPTIVMNDTETATQAAGLVAITTGEARRLFTAIATAAHRTDLRL